DLHEEVYMALPPGLPNVDASKVCKLQKSLYIAFKQASRQWYSKLSTSNFLGYSQIHADHSLYVKTHKTFFTAILV
nr:retrotransposon peptide {Ty1-copia retrotransposon element, clone Sat 40} [Vicia sativa, leaves, Peptide Transposon Partial, 75 aa] [Vicia sativa]